MLHPATPMSSCHAAQKHNPSGSDIPRHSSHHTVNKEPLYMEACHKQQPAPLLLDNQNYQSPRSIRKLTSLPEDAAPTESTNGADDDCMTLRRMSATRTALRRRTKSLGGRRSSGCVTGGNPASVAVDKAKEPVYSAPRVVSRRSVSSPLYDALNYEYSRRPSPRSPRGSGHRNNHNHNNNSNKTDSHTYARLRRAAVSPVDGRQDDTVYTRLMATSNNCLSVPEEALYAALNQGPSPTNSRPTSYCEAGYERLYDELGNTSESDEDEDYELVVPGWETLQRTRVVASK